MKWVQVLEKVKTGETLFSVHVTTKSNYRYHGNKFLIKVF